MFDSVRCLADIKLLLKITDNSQDAILLLLFTHCAEEFKNYTHNTSIENYGSIIENMVCFRYSLIGAEGITSEEYSGVTFDYATEYPAQIKNSLNACRKCVFI